MWKRSHALTITIESKQKGWQEKFLQSSIDDVVAHVAAQLEADEVWPQQAEAHILQ